MEICTFISFNLDNTSYFFFEISKIDYFIIILFPNFPTLINYEIFHGVF